MKLALRLSLSLAVAAALVGFLMAWGGTRPREVLAAAASLDPGTFALALGAQAAIYALRALRFRYMIAPARRPAFGRILPVSSAHSLASYVLPAKVGEASLVVYLRASCGVPSAEGLAVLLVSRILDLTTVAGSLSLACLALGASGTFPALPWLGRLGGVLFVLTIVFAWLGSRGHLLVRLATRASRAIGLARTRLGMRLVGAAERVELAMREVGEERSLIGAALSLPVWACVYLFYAVLARGLGMSQLSFPAAVFGASLTVFGNSLPISAFAGFGTQDAGWVLGFTVLGVDRELATQSALAFHLVYLLTIVAFGLAGHLAMGLARTQHSEQASG